MKLTYAVIMSEGPNNWGAYVPDVGGCISTGSDIDDMRRMIKEALEGHLDDWERARLPFPWPKCKTPQDAIEADIQFTAEIAAEWPDDPTDEDEGWSPPIAEMIEVEVNIPESALSRYPYAVGVTSSGGVRSAQ